MDFENPKMIQDIFLENHQSELIHPKIQEDIELDKRGPDQCDAVEALPSAKPDALAEDAKAEEDEEEKVVLVEQNVSA